MIVCCIVFVKLSTYISLVTMLVLTVAILVTMLVLTVAIIIVPHRYSVLTYVL